MSPKPVSISVDDTVEEALAFLTDRGFGAAPVIDDAGRPIGVLSHTDIMVHDRELGGRVVTESWFATEDVSAGEIVGERAVVDLDRTRVRDLMTPAVFSVLPTTPAARVVRDMVALKVHQMYVVDNDGVLVGVISALDVLRHLGAADPRPVATNG
jgi:CBS domain-containing protein